MKNQKEFDKIKEEFYSIGVNFTDKISSDDLSLGLSKDILAYLAKNSLFSHSLNYKNSDGIFFCAAALEGLTKGLFDIATTADLMIHIGLGMQVFFKFANSTLKETYGKSILAGEALLSVALTEPSGGFNPKEPNTTIVKVKDGYLLNGKKWCITNAPIADLVMVLVREKDHDEVSVVLVETNWSGVDNDRSLYIVGTESATGEIVFNDVFIPESHVIGQLGEGMKVINEAFIRERLLYSFPCLGLMSRVIEVCMAHAVNREISGIKMCDAQYVQKRLTDMYIKYITTQSLAYNMLEKFVLGQYTPADVSVAKIVSSQNLFDIITEATRLFGSYGVVDKGISRFLVQSLASTIAGGTEEAHRIEIYKGMRWKYRHVTRGI